MSYGSTAYGSAALGGSAASEWQVFFPLTIGVSSTLYESQAEFTGDSQFYSIFSYLSNTDIPVEVRIYTSNDLGETPQLQTVFSGHGQAVVGAARYMKVTAELGVDPNTFRVSGRPGD